MSKELKRKIKDLNKLKRQCSVGTEERRQILRQIREVKSKLAPIDIDDEKTKLIEDICKKDSWWKAHKEGLLKFTKEQLQKHLGKNE